MKICFIMQHYSKQGGIENVVRSLIEKYIDKHDVYIVTSSASDIQDKRIKFRFVKTIGPIWYTKWLSFFINSFFVCKKRNKEEHFDVIHKHGLSLYKSDIFTAHSVHKVALKQKIFSDENTIFQKIKLFILTFYPLSVLLERINLKRTKIVTSLSKGIKNELFENYGIKNSPIIANGINNDKIAISNISIKGIMKNDLKLVFVGKDFKRKGLYYIIDALDILVNKKGIKKIKLIVLGYDQVNYNNVESLIDKLNLKSYIKLLGHVTNVYDYYAFSDVFVFPTIYEAFSIATLEASKMGLPLLLYKTNGTEDLLIEGKNGFFIDRDGENIAKKIFYFYKNKDKIKNMGESAKKIALSDFNWDGIAKQYENLYKKIVSEKIY